MSLLKSNFKTQKEVEPDDKKEDEYEKKAIESISGSMVFVDRKNLLWSKK